MLSQLIRRGIGLPVLAMVCIQITAGDDLYAQNAPQSTQASEPAKTPRSQDAAAANTVNQRIAELIRETASVDFRTRTIAWRELQKLGAQMIPEVVKALDSLNAEKQTSQSRKLSTRCRYLLDTCLGSRDEPTRQAARRALKQLQHSKNRTTAAFATYLLRVGPRQQSATTRNSLQNLRPNGEITCSWNRPLSWMVAEATMDENYVTWIQVKESDQTTDITESPQGAIKMKVTQTADGKRRVSDYAADSEGELKKKFPDAHKAYKRARSFFDRNGMKERMQRLFEQYENPPARGRGFARSSSATQARRLQRAQETIDSAVQQMRALIKQAPLPKQEFQKHIEEIEAARRMLE